MWQNADLDHKKIMTNKGSLVLFFLWKMYSVRENYFPSTHTYITERREYIYNISYIYLCIAEYILPEYIYGVQKKTNHFDLQYLIDGLTKFKSLWNLNRAWEIKYQSQIMIFSFFFILPIFPQHLKSSNLLIDKTLIKNQKSQFFYY